MMAYRGSIAPLILKFGTRWKFNVPPLYPGRKNLRYPSNRRLGEPPDPACKFWRRENSLAPIGTRSPDRPSRRRVRTRTMLFRLPEVLYGRPSFILCSKHPKLGTWSTDSVSSLHSSLRMYQAIRRIIKLATFTTYNRLHSISLPVHF